MMEAELFDGTVLEFPDGTSPEVIQRVVKQQTMAKRSSTAAPVVPGSMPAPPVNDTPWQQQGPAPTTQPNTEKQGLLDGILGIIQAGMQGGNSLMGDIGGAPVDIVNNLPRVANLLPGVNGVGPVADPDNVFMGGETIKRGATRVAELFGGGAYEPQGPLERIANRAGYELAAAGLPVAGAMGKAGTMTAAGVRQLSRQPQNLGQAIGGMLVEPAAVNPGAFAGREATGALAAGLGAGTANEVVGNAQFGDNFWSDFLGSAAGVGAAGFTKAAVGAGGNLIGGATGSPRFADDVAGQAVADRIINNSTGMAEQATRLREVGAPPQNLDTTQLVEALRRPAAIEEAVPGYQANIGDRSRDPGLQTFAFNQDALSPGSANARRVANEEVVDQRMAGFEPGGDPARFRAGLQTGVDQQIAQVVSEEDIARAVFGDAVQQAQPQLRDATARGSSIRSGIADAYETQQQRVTEAYRPINEATEKVDVAPLRERFAEIDANLTAEDAARFRPSEAGIPAQLAPDQAPAAPASISTGLLDANGQPILRQPEAPPVPSSTVPLNEITSLRGGLTDDIRAQRAAGQNQAARVGSLYQGAVDDFTEQAISPELRAALGDARATRRDVADRFERSGTGIAESLRTREGGGYQMDDSAVPPRFAQPDQGRLSDLRSLLDEAGTDPRVRQGLADEVLSDVQTRGLIDRPEQLGRYMADRSVLLSEFPEVRTALERAGATRADLAAAEKAAKETTTRLTTPGRSPEASYLKYGDESVGDAIRTVTTAPKPREAIQQLLKTAGTPEARQDLRSALWTEVRRRGQEQAPGLTGNQRWNGKRLRDMFNDPKVSAVADELWADSPEDLADIKKVFNALAGAEGSTRARAAGSSGTAQSLSGKFDPALTGASVASTARSVNRGQLSAPIAVVDLAGRWLRRKSAQAQSRAIDQMASAVVNNPGLAADLLMKYNPAEAGARRRMITQKYGVRATQVLNLLDEMENEDPTMDAITGDQ